MPRITRFIPEDALSSPAAEGSRYLDVRGAAAYLSLSRYTIYERVAQKRIPFMKVGRKLLFDRADLDAWLNGMKRAPRRKR